VQFGLIISLCLHAALLGWAVLNIQAMAPLAVAEPEPVAVDLITPGDVTKLRLGSRTAKQLQAQPKEAPKPDAAKKEAPKPAIASAPPPPEPPPAAKEEPKIDPPKAEPPKPEPPKAEPKKEPPADKVAAVPPEAAAPPVPALEEQKKLEEMLKEQQRQADEQKKLEEEKRTVEEERKKLEDEKKRLEEETKKVEEQKRLEEERKHAELKKKQEEEKRRKEAELKKKREEEKKRKEAEAKKKFDAEKISALLNKIPDKGAPRPSVPLDEQAKSLNKGPVLGAPEGRDQQLSASELAILAQIIKSCVQSKWNVLGGGEGAQHTQVKIRLRFNPDGTLATAPVIMNPQNTPYFFAVSESAIRAVQACEPYSLPPAKYEFWKDIVLNFDPRDMF
jgi:colicin import membrane protein